MKRDMKKLSEIQNKYHPKLQELYLDFSKEMMFLNPKLMDSRELTIKLKSIFVSTFFSSKDADEDDDILINELFNKIVILFLTLEMDIKLLVSRIDKNDKEALNKLKKFRDTIIENIKGIFEGVENTKNSER